MSGRHRREHRIVEWRCPACTFAIGITDESLERACPSLISIAAAFDTDITEGMLPMQILDQFEGVVEKHENQDHLVTDGGN